MNRRWKALLAAQHWTHSNEWPKITFVRKWRPAQNAAMMLWQTYVNNSKTKQSSLLIKVSLWSYMTGAAFFVVEWNDVFCIIPSIPSCWLQKIQFNLISNSFRWYFADFAMLDWHSLMLHNSYVLTQQCATAYNIMRQACKNPCSPHMWVFNNTNYFNYQLYLGTILKPLLPDFADFILFCIS